MTTRRRSEKKRRKKRKERRKARRTKRKKKRRKKKRRKKKQQRERKRTIFYEPRVRKRCDVPAVPAKLPNRNLGRKEPPDRGIFLKVCRRRYGFETIV